MPVKDIMTGIIFCSLLGTVILCIVLVVSAILRWLKPAATRNKRLNILAWIAFAILCSMALLSLVNSELHLEDIYAVWGPALIMFFINVVSLMVFAAVIIAVMALLLIIILAVCKGLHIIIRGSAKPKDKKEELGQAAGTGAGGNEDGKLGQDTREGAGDGKAEEEKGFNLAGAIREPIVILSISWGILALFFLIPFLASGWANGDIIKDWSAGLKVVTAPFRKGTEDPFVTYALVYIAILGISFAVMKILYNLILHTFEAGRNQSMLDEYSSPIGLLAAGVALLWTFQQGHLFDGGRLNIIVELGKSFLTVVIIVTIFILTLEIIRMLIDIRGKLIRQEAKYLFIALAGHITIFMLGLMISICGALNNAIGNTLGGAMDSVEEKLRLKMTEALEKQIGTPENDVEDDPDDIAWKTSQDGPEGPIPRHDTAAAQKKSSRKLPTAFRAFYQKVTKK